MPWKGRLYVYIGCAPGVARGLVQAGGLYIGSCCLALCILIVSTLSSFASCSIRRTAARCCQYIIDLGLVNHGQIIDTV